MSSLTSFRGRAIVLAFYPADWSPVCGDQMSLYNHALPEFERLGATVVGVSVDSSWCHLAFAHNRQLHFPLLADFEPKGSVARAYGVYDEREGTAKRALFVIDADGIIRWSHVSPPDINPGADGILRALNGLVIGDTQPARIEHSMGPQNAPVTLVEYGDYECPHCRRAHPVTRRLTQMFGDQLRFVFRNFPLSQIHPHAMHAAEAAESVAVQAGSSAFWAMHDAIFAHQRDGGDALNDARLAEYAEASGADPAQVLADLAASTFTEGIRAELLEGMRRGVNGTPTFFVNDARFDGDWRDYLQLAAAIERAGAQIAIER